MHLGAHVSSAGGIDKAVDRAVEIGASRARYVDWAFIVPLLAGILIAVVTLASVIQNQLQDNPEEMAGIFFGLVAASTAFAWRLSKRSSQQLMVMTVVAVIVFVLLGWQAGPVADPSPLAFFGAGTFTGVGLCYRHDVPYQVSHLSAVHSKEGEGGFRSAEAILFHHADFTDFELIGG